MKSNELLEVIGEAQDAYILDANTPHKNIRPVWVKWAAAAACLCLIVASLATTFFLQEQGKFPWWPGGGNAGSEVTIYAVTVDGEKYWPMTFDHLKEWGIVPEDTVESDPQDAYVISNNDIGELIGIVEQCDDSRLIGAKLYHFSKYADNSEIAILEFDGTFSFYILDDVSYGGPGSFFSNVDPITGSIAVFPDTEILEDVASASLTEIDEETAYIFDNLGTYLPTHIKEGYHFAKASLYETTMNDGTKYYQLRVVYADGDISEADATINPETGEQSKDVPTTMANTYMVFVMNYNPGNEYTIYSGDALIGYINELPSNGVFHFALDDLYFGFVPYDLSSDDVMAVVASIFDNRNIE